MSVFIFVSFSDSIKVFVAYKLMQQLESDWFYSLYAMTLCPLWEDVIATIGNFYAFAAPS